MSGQQEQRDGREQGSQPEQPDQLGQPDGTLVMAQSSVRGQDRPNGHVRTIGTSGARTADSDPYLAIGETAGRHRSARSLFDPAPPADPAPAAVAEPANQADATDGSETAEALVPPATESTADSRPHAGGTDAKPSGRGEPERAGTGQPGPAANLTPVPGSRADLRQRLERLPYGHPSSPYHVDGERKPPPPRLKHLELAPPVPDRQSEPPARSGADDLPDTDETAPAAQDHRTAEPARPSTPPIAEHVQQHSRPMPTFTPVSAGPPQPAAKPTTARAAADAAQRQATTRPGAGEADKRHPSAPSATPQGRSLPVGRGPGFNPSSTRPRTATDGSWTWGPARLTPDQVRIAEEGYDRFRAAEGRNLFGSYGSSGLTAKLRQVEGRLEHGRLEPGMEERALLQPDVFRARFADMLRRHPDRSPELLVSRVPGALSYAFIFGVDHYADGILQVQDALEAQGFELQARKNSWNSVANRCVFTMWHDPLTELPFEVQFHTSASLEAQQLARTSATLINDPRIPPEEAASLRADLASAWAALASPPGNAEISDYRRYGSATPRR